MKKLASVAATAAVIGMAALAIAPSAMATPNGGVCQLTGTANFGGAGLTTTSSPFSYNFSGTLTNCHSGSTAGLSGPTGGTIATIGPGTYNATGSGGCVSSTTSGIALITWSDNDTSVVSYTTTGALAGVVEQGKVLSSYSYTITNPDGTTTTFTYTTNEPATPAGDSVGAALTFTPASPTACNTGVTSAAINGVTGTGNDA